MAARNDLVAIPQLNNYSAEYAGDSYGLAQYVGDIAGKTGIAAAIALLRKFGSDAHLWLPGVGTINGLTTGNYLESTGNTLLTVDNPAGLVLDALGTVGSELWSDTGVTVGTGWVQVGNAYTHTAGSIETVSRNIGLVAGVTYEVSATCSGRTAGSWYFAVGGSVETTASTTNGVVRSIIKSGVNALLYIQPDSAFNGVISSISVREVSGIHLTQATTASKPILRRGATNLLLQSDTFSGWSTTTMSLTAGATDPLGGTTAYTITSTGANADIAKLTSLVGSGVSSIWIRRRTGAGAVSMLRADYSNWVVLAVTNEWVRYSDTRTCSGNAGAGVRLSVSGDAVDIWHPQLETGSTASDYSPTTTAAASNPSAGRYSWGFDGSNDSLSLGSVPFTLSDDFAVITSVNTASGGEWWDVLFSISGSTAKIVFYVDQGNGGIAKVELKDDSGLSKVAAGSADLRGATSVISFVKTGSTAFIFVNGTQAASVSLVGLGVATLTNSVIGNTSAGADTLKGSIYYINALKGVLAESERKLIEKLAASAAGITI